MQKKTHTAETTPLVTEPHQIRELRSEMHGFYVLVRPGNIEAFLAETCLPL